MHKFGKFTISFEDLNDIYNSLHYAFETHSEEEIKNLTIKFLEETYGKGAIDGVHDTSIFNHYIGKLY